MINRLSLGKLGERIACGYLNSLGYKIIEMNHKDRWEEIDIVALEKEMLVFVEVKTRMKSDRITPEDSMTPRKIRQISRSAVHYKIKNPKLPQNLRIDYIGIVLKDNLEVERIRLEKNISM